jgi:hypothetical protein
VELGLWAHGEILRTVRVSKQGSNVGD